MTNNKAKIIGISSLKGGVGKTTFTIWLSGIYASMNKRVLILDMDLYSGGVTTMLNLKIKKDLYDISDDLKDKTFTNINKYIIKYSDYINVIVGSKNLTNESKIDFRHFNKIIKHLESIYDVILVDTSQLVNSKNILDKCDNVLYLVSNDLVSIKNTRNIVEMYKNMEKKNYFLILNNSLNKERRYFSNLDIKIMIKDNIDYVIPHKMYIENIDKYTMDGKIMTLEKDFVKRNKDGIKVLNTLAKRLLDD